MLCFFVAHESIDDDAAGRKRRNYSFNATHLICTKYTTDCNYFSTSKKREFIVKIWCMKSEKSEQRASKGLLSFFTTGKSNKKSEDKNLIFYFS